MYTSCGIKWLDKLHYSALFGVNKMLSLWWCRYIEIANSSQLRKLFYVRLRYLGVWWNRRWIAWFNRTTTNLWVVWKSGEVTKPKFLVRNLRGRSVAAWDGQWQPLVPDNSDDTRWTRGRYLRKSTAFSMNSPFHTSILKSNSLFSYVIHIEWKGSGKYDGDIIHIEGTLSR